MKRVNLMAKKLFTIIVILTISLIIALAAILSNQTPTETVVTGVVAGNVFTYDIKGYSVINEANATIPESFSELNMTEWYRVTITSVSGPDVSFNTTWRFVNGTEIENMGNVNVLTGEDNRIFWAIYPANLTLNDLVSPSGSDGLIVNQTEIKTYKDGPRDTNIITLQTRFVDADDPTLSRTYDDYLYVHFDRVTGMLVELRDMKLYTDPQVILTIDWELIGSNVWAVA